MELKEAMLRAEAWTENMTTWEKEESFFGVMEALLTRIKSLEQQLESATSYAKRVSKENECLSLDLGLKNKDHGPLTVADIIKDAQDKSSW
jgi:hypothetical protein